MIKDPSAIEISVPTNPRAIPEDAKAHHPKPGSKEFVNPWPSFDKMAGFSSFIAAKFRGEIDPKEIPEKVREIVGVETPSWETGNKGEIKAIWLGHACFYIELPCNEDQERGLRVLFDPVLAERCSPVSFAGPKRYIDAPASVDTLPEIDFVCISHNHYDHLEESTMKALSKRFGNSIHFFVPLGVASFFHSLKITTVTELDWWEERILRKGTLEARIGYLPAQHFTDRGLFDRQHTLWGSFSVESTSHAEKNVWFAGDTGRRTISRDIEKNLPKTKPELDSLPVCPAHKQIGDLRGPFALAMIPIGAYLPRYLMSPVHIDPEEAVSLFKEVRAKKAVGMHWGTWVLSAEDVVAPRDELIKQCKEQGVTGFEIWKMGERREV